MATITLYVLKQSFTLIFILFFYAGFGQSIIEWKPDYHVKLEDFQSPETEINDELTSNFISTGTNMDFSFQMSAYHFMFKKNFNSEIKTTFNKKAAVIITIDTLTAIQLVRYGQYCFDLTELYTRKFRKEMYDQKGAFSDVNFFKPIFHQLQEEMTAEMARVSKATDLGRNEELLNIEHEKILHQIELLYDFCLECKPTKVKKKKKD